MAQDTDTGARRWLLKAVRESSGELFGAFGGVDEDGLCWRPAADEWCLKDIAAHLRDAEVLYQRQIEAIVQRADPFLPYESIDVLPAENDYRSQPIGQFLREWEDARQETVWLLRMLGEEDWQRTGRHPYRGRVSIYDLVRELHEHDLEHLYQARRLRESALVRR
jgi:hypothetical protein